MTLGTTLFLGFIILQRLSELFIAKRNTTRLLARGAHEVGAGALSCHSCHAQRVDRVSGGFRLGQPSSDGLAGDFHCPSGLSLLDTRHAWVPLDNTDLS